MSLLINGMDMPKDGRVTIDLASEETGTNNIARITDDKTGKLIEHKGIVVIPTHHGRLIDADVLLAIMRKRLYGNPEFNYIIGLVERQRTIIEAEDGE